MNYNFHTQGFRLAESQEDYAREKLSHVLKNAPRSEDESTIVKVDVEKTKLSSEDQRFLVEVTAHLPRTVIRAEVFASTVEEGIDNVEEKLRKQVERYKGKMHRRNDVGEWIPESTLENFETEMSEESTSPIAKRKRYESTRKPMTEEEAIENLELLGHDFYLFENADTGRFSVLYRRYEGNYGIIEPLKSGETKED